VAIGGGGTAHREVAQLIGDATEGERAVGLLGFERSGSEKNLISDYQVGERRAIEFLIDCITSSWYIFIGVPMCNPREGATLGLAV
jgi:hypothetical protein